MGVTPATFEEQLAYDLQHGTKKEADEVLLGYDDKGNPVYGPNPYAGQSNYGIDASSPESIGRSIELEVQRRRRLIAGDSGQGFQPLPPDIADMVVRDSATGMVRRTRAGSTRSAILGAFSPTAPLGASSILGSM